jgi:hypothetical protein
METAETAVETNGDGSGGTSPSRQGARTKTSVPRNLSSMAAALRNYSGKILIDLGFGLQKALNRRRGGARGPPGGPHHPWARPGGVARPLMVCLPSGPPPTLVRSSVHFREK